jgi:hypothetical protein
VTLSKIELSTSRIRIWSVCSLISRYVSEEPAASIFRIEGSKLRQQVPPKYSYLCTTLHYIKSRKTVILILKSMVVWVVTPCNSESQTFRRNILPPSSWMMSKPCKRKAGHLPPKRRLSPNYTALQPTRRVFIVTAVITSNRTKTTSRKHLYPVDNSGKFIDFKCNVY